MQPIFPGRARSKLLIVGVVAIAASTPLLSCLLLARQQAIAEQRGKALFYAADVLNRAETTGRQVEAAFRTLARLGTDRLCEPDGLALMAGVDASSSYLQFVGVVRDDTLVCSSYGPQAPVPIGPPEFIASTGYRYRGNVALPFASRGQLAMFDRGGLAAGVHRSLPVDSTVDVPGVSLAVVSWSRDIALSRRGPFRRAWTADVGRLAPGQARTFVSGRHIVAQRRSAAFPNLVAVAAVGPQTYDSALVRALKVAVPFGVVAAALLGWLAGRLAMLQASPATAIRMGLRNHEFFLLFQPIVRLEDRRWVGAEALLRWRRADGRTVPPDVFIPIAEDAGLIRRMTARALELAEPALLALHATPGFFLSINLAPDDLHTDATAEALQALLDRTGAHPACVHLEITERGFTDTEVARSRVRALRQAGFHVSIDDFGTGYSSLSELLNLQLDTLKIDKAFVEAIGSGAATSQVAFHITEMARGLSLAMIAEGIEHEAQARTLRDWKVDYGQGWLFSRPLTLPDLLDALQRQAPAAPPEP